MQEDFLQRNTDNVNYRTYGYGANKIKTAGYCFGIPRLSFHAGNGTPVFVKIYFNAVPVVVCDSADFFDLTVFIPFQAKNNGFLPVVIYVL